MLRPGLVLADRIVAALPAPAAYALADLAGDAWHRLAPSRRRLVASNLARVCAATGRPTRGAAFTALVRASFRNHARYYVELLRAPHYPIERITEHVECPDWETYRSALASRPGIIVSGHVGNFEPFGSWVAAHGFRPLAPVEEIEPRELYEFLAARRGGSRVDLVPLREAGRALARRLREGGLIGIIGDRDLNGDGQPVTMFGHPTTIPIGPAALAVNYRAGLVVGRCLRTGPDRFLAEGAVLDVPDSGDRRADTAALTERIAARLEADIGAAPEQWWGAFQPFWPDLRQ
jgi:lauroyl/myristoyl acyltransferase